MTAVKPFLKLALLQRRPRLLKGLFVFCSSPRYRFGEGPAGGWSRVFTGEGDDSMDEVSVGAEEFVVVLYDKIIPGPVRILFSGMLIAR